MANYPQMTVARRCSVCLKLSLLEQEALTAVCVSRRPSQVRQMGTVLHIMLFGRPGPIPCA